MLLKMLRAHKSKISLTLFIENQCQYRKIHIHGKMIGKMRQKHMYKIHICILYIYIYNTYMYGYISLISRTCEVSLSKILLFSTHLKNTCSLLKF